MPLEAVGHGRQPGQARAPAQREQQRLHLVVRVLGQPDLVAGLLGGLCSQTTVAGTPRRIFRALARRMARCHTPTNKGNGAGLTKSARM